MLPDFPCPFTPAWCFQAHHRLLGLWIFLLSDIVMFSATFAAYAVLQGNTAGGPSGAEIFVLRSVGIETAASLASSFTCRLASVAAVVVLAIAQMGVHLVFFLHISTAPDNTNNVLALAFGVLIVFLVIAGPPWIMAHSNHNMMPTHGLM